MPDIYLRAGDATPSNVILRDPTTADAVGGGETTVRRYYRGRPMKPGAVMLSKRFYYVDEAA
jgi:hypothetical protein